MIIKRWKINRNEATWDSMNGLAQIKMKDAGKVVGHKGGTRARLFEAVKGVVYGAICTYLYQATDLFSYCASTLVHYFR